LKCWQRNYYDAVPGCTGRGGRHWDYCYDPQKKATREAMTRDYTHLANFGATPIGVNLGKCVGDCDLDGHCKSGLKCFHRNGNENIPGCKGSGPKGYDFCYNPADLLKEQMAKDHSSLKDYGWTPIGNTLGKCVGDCDHNGHCRGGLKCWHRDANERVPGCSGRAVSILDYCYDPKDLAANHNSLVNYGWTPSGAPMGACAGDCDHNGHCTGALVCQQRNNYEKVSGCSGTAEYGVDYCVKPTKNPTKSPTKKPTDSPTASPTESPTKNPTESPTKNPTASPTLSPTERCDANNCMNWSCLDWCECYDEAQVSVYESHAECQDDNDDTCICFDKEESETYGERHRKINYNQDAVDAGTAKMIEGTNVHVATKQNHMGGYHLTCGRHNPRECKEADKVTMNANEKHEVRCCSDVAPSAALKKKHSIKNCATPHSPGPSVSKAGGRLAGIPGVWGMSKVGGNSQDQCVHSATFTEARDICAAIPNGRLCTETELHGECTSYTGCMHDMDLIWVLRN
jgi:hypothetical protein